MSPELCEHNPGERPGNQFDKFQQNYKLLLSDVIAAHILPQCHYLICLLTMLQFLTVMLVFKALLKPR